MNAVYQTVAAFRKCEDIKITRLKDRFYSEPTSGGWRDIMMNFVVVDHNAALQGEVQIVHEKMLTARTGLDGHTIYHNARNAGEMLEFLGVGTSVQQGAIQ